MICLINIPGGVPVSLDQQIREAFTAEHSSGAVPTEAHHIPSSYEIITDAWLSAVLCSQTPGAKITSHRLDVPDEGTNNRRRIFLEYNQAGLQAGLPRSVFCKATQGLANRLMLGHSGGVICEVTFYNRARQLLDIEAPRCWHANYDPVSFNSIVVLDDFAGDAEFFSHDMVGDRARIESQIDLLAALHSRFYEAPELGAVFSPLPTWYERFNNLRRFHLEESCSAGFQEGKRVIPARLFARQKDIWPATLKSLELQRDLPMALCHGDVHLKNWYLTSKGKVGLGDWGVTHKGHWSRDLIYTITTGLSIANRRAWDRDLIQYYLERMAARGVPAIPLAEAMTYCRQALMTAFAFWTLTLKPTKDFPDMQPQDTALAFIERLAHAIDDMGSLDSVLL
jgi:thiamine kinase-like enzyme